MSPARPAGAFRVIELPTGLSKDRHRDRVVKAQAFDSERRLQHETRQATDAAAVILEDAQARADALIREAMLEAERLHMARLVDVEAEMADQLARVADALGDAVAASVESIYRSIFRSDPGLLIEATVKVARHVLREHVGAVLQLSVADRDSAASKALEDRFSVQSNPDLPNGVLLVRGEDGDFQVDASRLIEDLGQDLRLCFRQVGQTAQSRSEPSHREHT
jgi:hypothetical protein